MGHTNKRVKFSSHKLKKTLMLTSMVIPGAVLLFVMAYIPMGGAILAFKEYTLVPGAGFVHSLINSPWVGLRNFEFMFTTNTSWVMLRNTLAYNVSWLVITTVISITFAILISEITKKIVGKVYQTVMFFPHFLSWIVISYFFFIFLNPSGGVLNNILASMGREPIRWYFESQYWPFILTIATIWRGTGFGSIFYLGAIAGIDKSMYESAMIDGATKWKQIWYITLPSLKKMVIILTILGLGNIIRADFGLFYAVPRNSGPLFPVTQVLDTFVYRALMGTVGVQMPLGMVAAAGFFQSVVGLAMILTVNGIVRKVDPESSLF